jgi:hypothetical protein
MEIELRDVQNPSNINHGSCEIMKAFRVVHTLICIVITTIHYHLKDECCSTNHGVQSEKRAHHRIRRSPISEGCLALTEVWGSPV